MSLFRSKTPNKVVPLVACGVVALFFVLLQHWEYQAQNPGVEAKYMTRSSVAWRASTEKPAQPMLVVKRVCYDFYYNCWVYEVRQGPKAYRALEIELQTYYP